MADQTFFGNYFEDLISDDEQTKKLLSDISAKKIGIVSPTVQGLLDTFSVAKRDELGIDSCTTFEFSGQLKQDLNLIYEKQISIFSQENKESSQDPTFIQSALQLTNRVESMRSNFLPKNFADKTYGGSPGETQNKFLKFESYENTLLRMIGLPDDKDIFDDGSDKSSLIFYLDPIDAKIKTTKLSVITGENTSSDLNPGINNILVERRFNVIDNERKYSFDKVATTITEEQYKTIDDIAAINTEEELKSLNSKKSEEDYDALAARINLITKGPGVGKTENVRLNYYNPKYLPAFYYLKIPAIQDSLIYGCIAEPSKVVLKPFDLGSFSKINGVSPQKSLLETIIRIRLDRITGNPGVYPTAKESAESENKIGLNSAKNKSQSQTDEITEVECFLIEKLKTILFDLGDEYKKSERKKQNIEIKKEKEIGRSEIKETEKYSDKIKNLSEKEIEKNKEYSISYLKKLETLKAREDAILFLLKDKSSSSSSLESSFSSFGIQDGTIRSSSGFSDALSGPLYATLSQRSEFYDKKITEVKRIIEMLSSGNKTVGPSKPPGGVLSTYLGVSPEDLIIYCIALLSIDQDYLIGLLTKPRRIVLVNTISDSILSSGRDPYGLKERLDLPPDNGGFPKVIDSVNALTLIVAKLYLSYIDYVAGRDESKEAFYESFLAMYYPKK